MARFGLLTATVLSAVGFLVVFGVLIGLLPVAGRPVGERRPREPVRLRPRRDRDAAADHQHPVHAADDRRQDGRARPDRLPRLRPRPAVEVPLVLDHQPAPHLDHDRARLRWPARSLRTRTVQARHESSCSRTGGGRIDTGELAALGAFFAVETHEAGTSPTAPWRPLRELLDQPRRLDERVQSVRAALAGAGPVARIELRVAASITHLGVVARLLAPTIGAAALGLERAALGSDDLWWQDQLGGPFPLSIVDFTSGDAGPLVGSAVEAITVATAACYALSPQVLWGNVASAANSAACLIASCTPRRRPPCLRCSRPCVGRPENRGRTAPRRAVVPSHQLLPDLPHRRHQVRRMRGLRPLRS